MSIDSHALLMRMLVPPDADFHAEIQRAYEEGWVTAEFLEFLEKSAKGEIPNSDWPPELLSCLLASLRTPEYSEAHDAVSSLLAQCQRGMQEGVRLNYYALLSRLLLPPDRDVHAEIRRMDRQGWLTPEFRRFLEKGAIGEIENPACEPSLFTWLLGEILDVRFIPPDISPKLRVLYETRIRQTLELASLEAAMNLLDEMDREGLFNRQFLEFLGNALNVYRADIGQAVADSIWEAVTERARIALSSQANRT